MTNDASVEDILDGRAFDQDGRIAFSPHRVVAAVKGVDGTILDTVYVVRGSAALFPRATEGRDPSTERRSA